MQLPDANLARQRQELAAILPDLVQSSKPELIQQLQKFGFDSSNITSACYALYDKHGIDPLLEVHPLRASFYQMELANDHDQSSSTQDQPNSSPSPPTTEIANPDITRDYVRISKDTLLLFMAIGLFVLLLLQLLPKP